MRWFALGLVVAACGYGSVDGSDVVHGAPESKSSDPPTPIPTVAIDAGTREPIVAKPVDGSAPSTACQVADDVLCFTFEGNTADQSPDDVPGTATGVTFVPGKENLAGSFTATSSVQFAPNPVFDLPIDSATIEAWIKRTDTGADAVVFDDDGRFSLTIQANGGLLCKSSGGQVAGVTSIPAGQWQHVACVLFDGQIIAYLNANEEARADGAITAAPTLTAALGMNAPPGSAEGDQHYVGLIDSFRLLKVARSPIELQDDAK
jgi:hypothetical protein